MKRKDIRQLSDATILELEGKVGEARTKLRGLNFEREVGKLKNPHAITMLRKDIARMLTFINGKRAIEKP